MPARSPKQQRAAGADVARCRKGQKPITFGDCGTARDFARKPKGGFIGQVRRAGRKAGR